MLVVTGLKLSTFCWFLASEIAITWLGASKLGAHTVSYLHPSYAQISTFHVQQIYSYKRINKFSRKKLQFFLKFRVYKSRSRDLGFSKLAYVLHNAFNFFHIISKIQLSMFNRFLVINKSINFSAILSKRPSENKGPTRAREVPIKFIKSNWSMFWQKLISRISLFRVNRV